MNAQTIIGWELLMLVSALVLNGEKGGAGILAAFVVFNLLAVSVILIRG